MVVTDQSAPTAPADIFSAQEKEILFFKKSSPLLEAESQHFKQQKTASCRSIHGKTTKNQRCKHREKPRSLSISSPLLLFRRKAPKASNLFFPPFNPV
jgi:hypothetical protein